MPNWTEKYINLLSENRNDEAFNLKKQYLPNYLYRYRPLNEYTLQCLSVSSVWMSPVSSLNDQFESFLNYNESEFSLHFFNRPEFQQEFLKNYNVDVSDDEVIEIRKSNNPNVTFEDVCKRKGIIRDFSKGEEIRQLLFNDFQNRVRAVNRAACFSERNDSILMWSHYADSHKGICIEYSFTESLEILNFLEPIFYSDNRFRQFTGSNYETKDNRLKISALHKAKDWQYEKEWRITFPLQPNQSNHYRVPIPKAIFLGMRFDENEEGNRKLLENLSVQFSIPIIKMNSDMVEYKIIPKDSLT